MNMARICIDECRGKISGRVYSKLWPTPLKFSGLGEMLLEMDQMFDECGYPQAFQERRSFREQTGHARSWNMPKPKLGDREMSRQRGRRYTFDLLIQSRRQTGWQGVLLRTDRTLLAKFNSEMELLSSICRVLDNSDRKSFTERRASQAESLQDLSEKKGSGTGRFLQKLP